MSIERIIPNNTDLPKMSDVIGTPLSFRDSVDTGSGKPDERATRNKVFAQASAPTEDYKEGDLWFDTDDGNTIYRANASLTWVSVQNEPVVATMTYGATINGATLPVPVYLKASDSEIYACDADDTATLAFIGFAISNSTDGNTGSVQISGVVSGLTGLTAGSNYFVQNAVGTVGTSKGTYTVLVGKAVSTTEIQLFAENVEGSRIEFVQSANLKASADTERSTTNATYIKVKEIAIKHFGSVNVKFDLKCGTDGAATIYAQIYVNDVATGTERSTSSGTYATYSENISSLDAGDLIQLYYHGTSGIASVIRNFRLHWDKVSVADYVVNTD